MRIYKSIAELVLRIHIYIIHAKTSFVSVSVLFNFVDILFTCKSVHPVEAQVFAALKICPSAA